MNPTIKSRGYGTTIVEHLIAEAVLLVSRPGLCHDVLFLDVYLSSEKAISLYTTCEFVQVAGPISDPQEDGKEYMVMARRVSTARPA